MEIKLVEEKDINQIVLLEEEAFGETLGYQLILECLTCPIMKFICMKEGEKVLGYIAAIISGNYVELMNFVVHKDYRHQGIGAQLLDYYVKDDQYKTYTLEVRPSNMVALTFYESRGFKKVSVRSHYYKDGEDAFVMNLEKEGE